MGLACYLEDERGKKMDSFLDPKNILLELLLDPHEGFLLTKYIDPYGDTVFNQLQIPQLITELKLLESLTTGMENQEFIRQLIEFVEKSRGKIHCYIKFYGD